MTYEVDPASLLLLKGIFETRYAHRCVIYVPTRDILAVKTKVLLFYGWQNLNIKTVNIAKPGVLTICWKIPFGVTVAKQHNGRPFSNYTDQFNSSIFKAWFPAFTFPHDLILHKIEPGNCRICQITQLILETDITSNHIVVSTGLEYMIIIIL